MVRQRWAPTKTLPVHCGRLSVEKHAHRSIDTVAALQDSGVDARLVVVGEDRCAPGWRKAARLPVDFTGYIGCRDTVVTILASADVALAAEATRRSGWPRLKRRRAAPGRRVANVGACGDSRHRQRRDGGQRPGRDRASRDICHQQTRAHEAQQRAPTEHFTWPRAAAGMLSKGGIELARQPATQRRSGDLRSNNGAACSGFPAVLALAVTGSSQRG